MSTITLLHKELHYESLLYSEPVTEESFARDFEVKSGEWSYRNGSVVGKNPEEFPGMIILKKDFFGDVMVDFVAKVLPPSTHDINVMWNGSWNEDFDTRGVAYVAGLGGWWGGKAGIEKSPDYRLNVGTPLFDLVPGREYHIQAGSCAGHCFIIVDGRLIIEVTDPDPIDSSVHGKVGFEAFASQIAIREIKVYSLTCKMLREHYSREL